MVYVLSDIHGNERRFNSILRQIDLQPNDVIYVLGDVIDRHPGGIRILRRIMAADNIKMVLGNHEYMMLEALGYAYDAPRLRNGEIDQHALSRWYRNGGKVTHDHLKRIRKSARSEIIQYLLELPLQIDIEVQGESYALVHTASVDDFVESSRYFTPAMFAVWNRWDHTSFPHRNSTLVFGHTPTIYYQDTVPMEIKHGENCIAIDCGSGYPEESQEGRLACLRLDDGKVFYSEEGCYDH